MLRRDRGKQSPKAKRASKKASPKKAVPAVTVQRFAHPFYEHTPANASSPFPDDAGPIADFTAQKLLAIPAPKRNPPEMKLADVIGNAGAATVKQSNRIVFHACGDSGNPQSQDEEMVSDAMTAEYDTTQSHASPAFLLHLGDVIYYDNTDSGYHQQFYAPYKRYPGKIIAIPGNHDGELFKFDGSPTGQKVTLGAFQQNFCLPTPSVPPAAGTIYRQMVSQPGVYWRLDAPFVDVIGLYSNVGETSGFISDPTIGTAQKDWLVRTIAGIAKLRASGPRKAFILAVHHPPYSNGGHEPSVGMLGDLDDACKKGGLMPDVVLAAHAHNYQRYTRRLTFGGTEKQIPYIVAGTAGRGIQSLTAATGQVQGDATYLKSMTGYGFLRVTVVGASSGAASQVTLEFMKVEMNSAQQPISHAFDSATVDLATAKVR